jgi:hypothetical protein
MSRQKGFELDWKEHQVIFMQLKQGNYTWPLFLGDFALHLYCCRMMMPYFFSAKHVNYARYGICYINTMENLRPEVLTQFM